MHVGVVMHVDVVKSMHVDKTVEEHACACGLLSKQVRLTFGVTREMHLAKQASASGGRETLHLAKQASAIDIGVTRQCYQRRSVDMSSFIAL
jgi:hypothetical protein